MSLINDALKRAKQAQQQTPPPPQQFQPVESAQVHSGPSFLLPGLIVILLVAGGVFIGLALNRHEPTLQVAAKTPQTTPVVQQAPQPKPVATMTPAIQHPQPAAPAQAAAAQNPGAADVTGTPAKTQPVNGGPASAGQVQQAVAEIAPPKPVVPTLRGIYYNPTRPSAVLDARTVFVGGSVNGFRVVEINRNSVTITSAGQTNVLTLDE